MTSLKKKPEPLKNKKIRVNAYDVHKEDRCNICFHLIDVELAVDWLENKIKSGVNKEGETLRILDVIIYIEEAFEDVTKK